MVITKKKILKITVPIVAVLLVVSILFLGSSAPKVSKVENNRNWSEVKEGIVELKNDRFTLSLDTASTHFKITDKSTKSVYNSVAATPDTEGENQSEIIIEYYDANCTLYKMNSFKNSVSNDSAQVFKSDNAIKVVYSIRKSKIVLFVPKVLTKETFEELTGKLGSGERRRLRFFYTLYESGANDKETEEMKSKYPALEDNSLYILNDSATQTTFEEITSYMKLAEYSREEYIRFQSDSFK